MKYKPPRAEAIYFWPIYSGRGGGGHGTLAPPPGSATGFTDHPRLELSGQIRPMFWFSFRLRRGSVSHGGKTSWCWRQNQETHNVHRSGRCHFMLIRSHFRKCSTLQQWIYFHSLSTPCIYCRLVLFEYSLVRFV